MHAVLQAKMPRWLACTSSSIIIQQESNKPINQLVRAVFSRHARMADGSHARARAAFLLLQCPAAACKCNAADPCPSDRVFLCQLLWTVVQFHLQVDLTRDNTYIPFCKVEGFEQLYPRRHRREGRSPGQGFTASLLLSCMLTQLVFFGSCCMPTVIVNYSLQSKT